jgi:hypothetical protein
MGIYRHRGMRAMGGMHGPERMSLKMSMLAWKYKGGRTDKLLLLALADYADVDGEGIRPSQATLAAKVCCTERHLRRVLRDLREARLIEPVANRGGGRPGAAVIYRINVARLTAHVDGALTSDTDVRPTADADVLPHSPDTPDILNIDAGHSEQKPRTPMSDEPKEEPKEEPKARVETLRVSRTPSKKKSHRKKIQITDPPETLEFTDKHRRLAKEARVELDSAWGHCRASHIARGQRRADWLAELDSWLYRELHIKRLRRVPESIDMAQFNAALDAREQDALRLRESSK